MKPYDNHIDCICASNKEACRSSIHIRIPLSEEDFIDSRGRHICHGDILLYQNPHLPGSKKFHKALIENGDCWIQPEGERPHRALSRGRWHAERFTIILPE